MYLTSLERFHAALTETYGSYPYTSIPSAIAALATNCPIAPRPMTPSFLPLISCPADAFLAFSVALATQMAINLLESYEKWLKEERAKEEN